MKREDLIRSAEYWLTKFQVDLFNKVNDYIIQNKLTRKKFAEQLGVSKGYVSQILNGNADHRMSKFIELSLAIDLIPTVSFQNLDDFVQRDLQSETGASDFDLEISKQNVKSAGYLLSNRPITKCADKLYSEEWANLNQVNNIEDSLLAS